MTITHPQSTNNLTLSYGSAGNYSGWDRFGRIVEQKWTLATGGTVLDHETYAYDRGSNMTARTNQLNSALSEVYSFDGLDRLSSMTRGGSAYQSWNLDGTGNWSGFTDQGSTQTRTFNAANEISTISGQNAPTHDAAGNVTQAPKPSGSGDQIYVLDGWNRLVKVKETNGTVIASFEYDGRNNRIEKTVGSNTLDYFHNNGSQVVEVRLNDDPDPQERYVWDLSYVDTPVVALRDTNTDGVLDARMYYLWDASRNVTAVMFAIDSAAAERYHYDPYGKMTVYTATWGSRSATLYGVVYTFTGREFDSETGIYYFRARYYDPALGRFLSRDPLGYVDGMSLYRAYFVTGGVDPWGEEIIFVHGYGGPGGSSRRGGSSESSNSAGKTSQGGSNGVISESFNPGGSSESSDRSEGSSQSTGSRSSARGGSSDSGQGSQGSSHPGGSSDSSQSGDETGVTIPRAYPLYRFADKHFEYDQVDEAVEYLIKKVGPPDRQTEPIIIIGHSWGGDSAVRIARELNARGYTVDFLATLDPVTNTLAGLAHSTATSRRPPKVKSFWNWHQQKDSPFGSSFPNADEDNSCPLDRNGNPIGHREIDDDPDIAERIRRKALQIEHDW